MRHRIRFLFMPPQMTSEEQTRLAATLSVILWVLLTATWVSAFFAYFLHFPITAITLCLSSLALLLSLWLTRQGCVNLAGFVALFSLLVAMTYLAFVGQGIFDRALLVFPIIIIIASLVLTQSIFILVTLLCVAAAGLLMWAELNGWIVTSFSERVSLFDFVAVAFILVFTAVLTRLTADNLQHSLSRAKENEQALTELNQELEAQKQALQQREREAHTFQTTLKTLHRVGFELSRAESLNELYRRAVELSLSELGFERVGLLLYDAETGEMLGTYGTDADGRVVDESYLRVRPGYAAQVAMLTEKSHVFLLEDAPLYFDMKEIGRGWNAVAALWDGDKGIGWLATDNLLSGQPPAPFQLDLLALYATTVGHLITRLHHAEALRVSEWEARQFQEKLQALHEVTLRLGQLSTLEELYQQAVQLGLSHLGFERLGLLLFDPETNEMLGTFGTDEQGQLIDERAYRQIVPADSSLFSLLNEQKRINVLPEANLFTHGRIVGKGWRATSALWDGQQGVGWLSTDNLLSGKPPKPHQLEILFLYSATLAHLITRKRTEGALQASEANARLFQEKLQTLHEVSIILAGTETLEDLYRQAIELGRSRLGFDRLGLLLYDEEIQMIVGTFGTDDDGRLRDERYFKEKIVNQEIMSILENNQRLGFWENAILRDNGEPIGQGWNAMSGLWNGSKGMGWLATDNLIRREPPSPVQLEILVLYGRMLGHLVTLKRNEVAIQANALELERSNRELQQFAYVSSHDLQEPLRKIQAFGDRLQERYAAVLDERGLDYLRRMQDAAARMQTLIQDVLTFSRVDTQTRPFTLVDLANVLSDVLSDLEIRIEETKAQINLQPLPTLEADPTQMRQLFQNLLSNALKFHQPGVPPVVEIRCERIINDLEEQQFCRIIVQDSGIGFEEKYSERIFGVFQRLHGRTEYEGTGVGLAVCRRIVERHHGRITATSNPGRGSTFTILLPKHQN